MTERMDGPGRGYPGLGAQGGGTTQQIRRIGGAARTWATQRVEARKDRWAGLVDRVGDAVHDVGSRLETETGPGAARIGDKAADRIHRLADQVRSRSADDVIEGAERSFRERPGAWAAGLAALGFVTGRLLRR